MHPSIQVPNEELPRVQAYIQATQPNAVVRRFIVDCHNGKQYWNNEFDHVAVNGMPESDETILTYLREQCYKYEGNKIYSCIEILPGSDLTLVELQSSVSAYTPELGARIEAGTKVFFFNPLWEPLRAYRIMP